MALPAQESCGSEPSRVLAHLVLAQVVEPIGVLLADVVEPVAFGVTGCEPVRGMSSQAAMPLPSASGSAAQALALLAAASSAAP
mmetsp:Transcript_2351/g.4660  ORF Transcript_2351/g.4660 Transcript_2351/m.4660 type:complete len:84 (-) Transcript_2351:412-663(-)